MKGNIESSQVVSKSIKLGELAIGSAPYSGTGGSSSSINADQAFANSIQTSVLNVADLDVGTISVENLIASTANLNTLEVSTSFAADSVSTTQLNIDTLNTTTSAVAQLFTNEISASQEITTNTYTVPHPQPANTLTDTQKILIGIGVTLLVAAVVVGVLLFSAGLGTIIAVAANNVAAVVVADLPFIIPVLYMGADTIAVAALGAASLAGSAAAFAVAARTPTTSAPDLRAVALNATFGKAFLSDMLFGTITNTSVSSPYVEYLLLQNEVNGSYALPRIIGYNPQLGFFDDGAYYGGVKAYLSLCTPAPYNTLRFEENGNLAIYDLTTDPPTWQSSTQVSSIKYKSGVRTITGAAATLQQIDCIYYNEGDVGVKAQQLEQLFSQATFGQGRRVRLEKLVPLLIEGMKELYELQELALGF